MWGALISWAGVSQNGGSTNQFGRSLTECGEHKSAGQESHRMGGALISWAGVHRMWGALISWAGVSQNVGSTNQLGRSLTECGEHKSAGQESHRMWGAQIS